MYLCKVDRWSLSSVLVGRVRCSASRFFGFSCLVPLFEAVVLVREACAEVGEAASCIERVLAADGHASEGRVCADDGEVLAFLEKWLSGTHDAVEESAIVADEVNDDEVVFFAVFGRHEEKIGASHGVEALELVADRGEKSLRIDARYADDGFAPCGTGRLRCDERQRAEDLLSRRDEVDAVGVDDEAVVVHVFVEHLATEFFVRQCDDTLVFVFAPFEEFFPAGESEEVFFAACFVDGSERATARVVRMDPLDRHEEACFLQCTEVDFALCVGGVFFDDLHLFE